MRGRPFSAAFFVLIGVCFAQVAGDDPAQFFQGCQITPGPTPAAHSRVSGNCLQHSFSSDGFAPGSACVAGATNNHKSWVLLSCNMDGKLYSQIIFDQTGRLINAFAIAGAPLQKQMTGMTGVKTKDLVVGTGDVAALNTFAIVRQTNYVYRPVPGVAVTDPHELPDAKPTTEAFLRCYIIVKENMAIDARFITDAIAGMKVGGKRAIVLSAGHGNAPVGLDVELVGVATSFDDKQARYRDARITTILPAAGPLMPHYGEVVERLKKTPVTPVDPGTTMTVKVPGQPDRVMPGPGQPGYVPPGATNMPSSRRASAEIAESSITFPQVDVIGLKLGMNEADARALVRAHNPGFEIDNMWFSAFGLAYSDVQKVTRHTDQDIKRQVLGVRKHLLDHTAKDAEVLLLMPPVHIGVGASAGDFGPPISLALLFQSDSELAKLMDDKGRTTEQIWFETSGEKNGVVDILYKGSFAKAARPGVETVIRALKKKYGEPSYVKDTHGVPGSWGSRVFTWIYDDSGNQIGASGIDTQRTELPEIYSPSEATYKPARLQVTIKDPGSMFASGFEFRLFHEQLVTQIFYQRAAKRRRMWPHSKRSWQRFLRKNWRPGRAVRHYRQWKPIRLTKPPASTH